MTHTTDTGAQKLYGDKALELFFGSNASGVATAMWATAMRNNYEDELARLRQTIATQASELAALRAELAEWHARKADKARWGYKEGE